MFQIKSKTAVNYKDNGVTLTELYRRYSLKTCQDLEKL